MKINTRITFIGFLLCILFSINTLAQSNGKMVQIENSFCKVYLPFYEKDYICEIDSCHCQKGYYSGNDTVNVYQQTITSEFNFFGPSTYDTTTTLIYKLTGDFVDGFLEGDGTYLEVMNEENEAYMNTEVKCSFLRGQFAPAGTITKTLSDEDTATVYVGEILNGESFGQGSVYSPPGTLYSKGIYKDGSLYDGCFYSDEDTTYVWKGVYSDELPDGFNLYPETGKPLTSYFDQQFNSCDENDAMYYWSGIYKKPLVCRDTMLLYYCSNKALAAKLVVRFEDYENIKNCYFEGEQLFYYPDSSLKQKNTMCNNQMIEMRVYEKNGDIALRSKVIDEVNLIQLCMDSTDALFFAGQGNKLYAQYISQSGKIFKMGEHSSPGYNSKLLQNYISLFSFDTTAFAESEDTYEYVESMTGFSHYISDDAFLPDMSDVTYTVRFAMSSKKNNNSFGFIFYDYNDDDYYEAFLVNNNQVNYSKYNMKGKLITNYFNGTYDLLTSDTVILKADKTDAAFSFFINDSLIYGSEDITCSEIFAVHGKKSGVKMVDYIKMSSFEETDTENAEGLIKIFKQWLNNEVEKDSIEDIAGFASSGTGFFIHKDGYFLTNHHVVSGFSRIVVETDLATGKKRDYEAEIVLCDKKNDIALLKIKDTSFHISTPIPYTVDTVEMNLGDALFTLGYPSVQTMGKGIKYTEGVINSLSGYSDKENIYQMSASVQPGNSGSPVFSALGSLVAITTSALLQRESFENVNYCVKAKYINRFLSNCIENISIPEESHLQNSNSVSRIKKIAPFVVLIKTM